MGEVIFRFREVIFRFREVIFRFSEIILKKNGMKIVAYLSCSAGRTHFAQTNSCMYKAIRMIKEGKMDVFKMAKMSTILHNP